MSKRKPTPEEELANWEEIYAAFRKETPSSPGWFQIADIAIGCLLVNKIASMKARPSPPPHRGAT